MGNQQVSQLDQGWGYRIIQITNPGPASNTDLQPFLDYIIDIDCSNDQNSSKKQEKNFFQFVNENENVQISLIVYNMVTKQNRIVQITPSRNKLDSSENLLGLQLRHEQYENLSDITFKISRVIPNSPAEKAGLQGNSDYLIGLKKFKYQNMGEMVDLVVASEFEKNNEEGGIELVVYSILTQKIRIVHINPNIRWGGKGSVGIEFGSGMLNQIPTPKNVILQQQLAQQQVLENQQNSKKEIISEQMNENIENILHQNHSNSGEALANQILRKKKQHQTHNNNMKTNATGSKQQQQVKTSPFNSQNISQINEEELKNNNSIINNNNNNDVLKDLDDDYNIKKNSLNNSITDLQDKNQQLNQQQQQQQPLQDTNYTNEPEYNEKTYRKQSDLQQQQQQKQQQQLMNIQKNDSIEDISQNINSNNKNENNNDNDQQQYYVQQDEDIKIQPQYDINLYQQQQQQQYQNYQQQQQLQQNQNQQEISEMQYQQLQQNENIMIPSYNSQNELLFNYYCRKIDSKYTINSKQLFDVSVSIKYQPEILTQIM